MTSKSKKGSKKSTATKTTGEFRSLTGHDFISAVTGKSHRVEPGEKIEGMNEVSVKHELKAGNIEPWEAYETDNVRTPEDEEELSDVEGVRVRHTGEDRDLVVTEVGE